MSYKVSSPDPDEVLSREQSIAYEISTRDFESKYCGKCKLKYKEDTAYYCGDCIIITTKPSGFTPY